MTAPPRHDWPKVIAEIEARGMSLYQIAKLLHLQYTQVKRIKDGQRLPLHHEGEMLLAILAEDYAPVIESLPVSDQKPGGPS